MAGESDADKLANLAIVAVVSESKSTVLNNSLALVEESESESTEPANQPKHEELIRPTFSYPTDG